MNGFREPITVVGGKLHSARAISVAARVANVQPDRWRVRAVEIPISHSGRLKAWPCPSTSPCLDLHFGLHAWIVHAYADAATSRFKMVGAKVVP